MPLSRSIPLLVVALLCTACSSEEVTQVSFSPVFDYFHQNRLSGETFDSGEQNVLYLTQAPDSQQLRVAPIGNGGRGALIELPPGVVGSYSYVPGQAQIVVAMEDEASGDRLYLGSAAGGFKELALGDGIEIEFYSWGGDGRRFFFGSNHAAREFVYLYSMDVSSGAAEIVLQTQDLRFAVASEDGRYLALAKPLPMMQSEMLYYDRETKKLKRQTPIGGGQLMAPQYFESGSASFVYLSDAGSGTVVPQRYLIEEARSEPLFPTWNLGSVLYARQSPAGSYVIVGEAGPGGAVRPRLLSAETGEAIELSGFEGRNWDILDISPSERWMSYQLLEDGEDSLFLYEFETGAHLPLLHRADLSSLDQE